MARAGALRQNYFQLPPTSFTSRKAFLTEALSNGSYLQPKPKEEKEGSKNPFEPAGGMDNMMDGMKKQMVMMIPQTVIMGWINFFFSGFVLRRYKARVRLYRTASKADPESFFLPCNSQTPVPIDTAIQGDAAAWY